MSFIPVSGILSVISDYTALDVILVVLDLFIVAAFLYVAFTFIKGTRAARIVAGLAVLAALGLLGRILQLETLNWLLSHLTLLIIVTIPIVFQPELRRGLERIGRSGFGLKSFKLSRRERAHIINEIARAVRALQKNKVGGLLVIQRQTGIGELLDSGTRLNAEVSAELILNIFTPKAPLHDGAVIIQGKKILAAGVLLPLSDRDFSYRHGTRHRAAIGITESSDAVAIVVSEERGTISIALDGEIRERVSVSKLGEELNVLIPKN